MYHTHQEFLQEQTRARNRRFLSNVFMAIVGFIVGWSLSSLVIIMKAS